MAEIQPMNAPGGGEERLSKEANLGVNYGVRIAGTWLRNHPAVWGIVGVGETALIGPTPVNGLPDYNFEWSRMDALVFASDRHFHAGHVCRIHFVPTNIESHSHDCAIYGPRAITYERWNGGNIKLQGNERYAVIGSSSLVDPYFAYYLQSALSNGAYENMVQWTMGWPHLGFDKTHSPLFQWGEAAIENYDCLSIQDVSIALLGTSTPTVHDKYTNPPEYECK
ncbi:MAG: hypothetical protein ACYCOR_20800 [Acidobacteriaceae bacterium]